MAEDEASGGSFLLPSISDQFKELAEQQGFTPSGETKKEQENVWDAEDLEGVIEIPFDIAHLATGCEDVALEEKELKKLSKLWTKPLNRLAGNVKNADLIVAASATAAIVVEKLLMYKLYLADRRKRLKELEGETVDITEKTHAATATARM